MGIRLFFIGLIVTALAGGGFYVMKLQKDNAILKANAIKLESAISDQKTLIENQKKDFESILTANKEMNDLIGKLKTDFADFYTSVSFNTSSVSNSFNCFCSLQCQFADVSVLLGKSLV